MGKKEKKFEMLAHTADIRLRVYGKDGRELFGNALLGMMAVLRPVGFSSSCAREIKLSSVDKNALLVDFLSEALYLSQTEDEAYEGAVFKELSDTRLEALLRGRKVQGFRGEIKAVSYQGVEIKKRGADWEATLIFDI